MQFKVTYERGGGLCIGEKSSKTITVAVGQSDQVSWKGTWDTYTLRVTIPPNQNPYNFTAYEVTRLNKCDKPTMTFKIDEVYRSEECKNFLCNIYYTVEPGAVPVDPTPPPPPPTPPPTPPKPPAPTPPSPPPQPPASGMSGTTIGIIVGSVVGGLVLIGGLVGLIIWLRRRKSTRPTRYEEVQGLVNDME